MSQWERYVDAFRKDLGLWAVWEPGDSVDAGDYGRITGGRWLRLGSVWKRLGEEPSEHIVESAPIDFQLGSASASAIGAGASADHVQALVRLDFKNEHALFVRATGSRKREVADLQDLAARIVARQLDWERHWLLVSSVRVAKVFSVVGATAAGSRVEVSGPVPDLQAFLAGGRVGADLTMSGSVGVKFLGRSGAIHVDLVRILVSPLSRNVVVKRRFGSPDEAIVRVEVVHPSAD